MLRILLLEDSPDDVLLIELALKKSGMQFTCLAVQTRQDMENALAEFRPDVILSDHSLPTFNSIEAFELFKAHKKMNGKSIPFILVTGNVSEEFAVQSIKAGIDDYILKDRLRRLPLAIESALEKCRMENEQSEYIRQIVVKEALMNEAEKLAKFGSWQADLVLGKRTWSDAIFHLYGYAPGEVEPDHEVFMSLVHPDDVKALRERYARALEVDTMSESEFRIIDKKGRTKYISSKLRIERDATGKAVRLIGFNLDITERRIAEIALKERDQQYRSLFDQNPEPVFSLDLNGRFTNANARVSEVTGMSKEALDGIHFRQFVHPDDLAHVYAHFSASLQGVPQRYHARILAGDGRVITMEIKNIPIVVNGAVVGVYGVASHADVLV